MGRTYTKKKNYRSKFRKTRRTFQGGMYVYNTNHIKKINTSLSLNLQNPIEAADILDTLGCHGLKYAEHYWKSLLLETYTLQTLQTLFSEPGSNPLVKKGLDILTKQPSAPVSYRTTFLEKVSDTDPEHPGIHIVCLDKFGFDVLHTRYKDVTESIPDTILKGLDEKKTIVATYLLHEAKPGLNLLLSCSQSTIINLLNNPTNTFKGPANGYYYLGFDKNVYYFNNTIIMASSMNYWDIPVPPIHYRLGNTSKQFLNKLETGIRKRLQVILKEGAVIFTTETLRTKLNKLVAHIRTAEYRKKQPIIPSDVGVFKLEDGAPYDIYTFENSIKNQNIGALSNNMDLQALFAPQIEEAQEQEHDAKRLYTILAEQHPTLVQYANNAEYPYYANKWRRIRDLAKLPKESIANEVKYEKMYTTYVKKHYYTIKNLHPDIWNYLNGMYTSSYSKLKALVKFVKNTKEAQIAIEKWYDGLYRYDNEDSNETPVNPNNI
jgi:hypothetical protein